jgi:DNA repair exonuclease SbcCD nuclease subunit
MVEGKVWDELCEAKLKILASIPRLIKKYEVDVVTIGGDIFDTSNPPEALKAEFCKILNVMTNVVDKHISVVIIPGRPGDHDYVADNNYVLMDLREAYLGMNSDIIIHPTPILHLKDGVMLAHLMLENISDFYKHTTPITDERFRAYNTILLGDYHGWYIRKFGNKRFIYPGAPYPTRFGENGRYVAIIDIDNKGATQNIKKIKLPTYHFLDRQLPEYDKLDDLYEMEEPFVVRFKAVVPSFNINEMTHELYNLKKAIMKENDNCLDIFWELKSQDAEETRKKLGTKSVRETCLEYIKDNAKYPKTTKKIFQKMEAQV